MSQKIEQYRTKFQWLEEFRNFTSMWRFYNILQSYEGYWVMGMSDNTACCEKKNNKWLTYW